jgi:Ca2+-binding RTX toxin-like protein
MITHCKIIVSVPLNLESWTEGIDFVEIYGGGGDDTFIGTDFGDLFWGNIANDEFDGRGGRDIALFNGGLTDYTITQNPDGSYVVNSWALNTHLVNIEVLRFLGDGTEFSLPIITSGGGGGNATYDISENTKSVTTVTAGPGVTYAIIGGADAAKFDIDAATGQLSLLAFPDFEHPADTGRDNSYVVKVRATGDGGITDDQTIRVNVLDVDEPTIIDSNGGGKRATINYQENGSGPVTFVHATDDDPGAIHYSIFSQNGGGAPIFQINSVSGELTFIAPPDFELSNPSHRYEVIVAALGGGGAGLTDYQTLTVRITDVDEAPSAPQLLGTSVEENSPGGTAVGTLSSVDPEGAVVSFTVSDSRFVVIGGVLTVAAGAVLDFETEPSINLTITARDPAGHETSRDLVISVTDGNEPPDIVFTPAGPDGVAEWTNFDRLAPSTGRGVLVGSIDMTDDGPSPTASQIHISDSRFRLTGSDGHYQLWAKLDFEQDPSTSVTVEFDGATKIIEVDVIDRDDLDVGSAGADVIYSGAMNDAAFGRGGADSLSGGAGDDVLLGGSGDDRLIGGVGDDVLLGGSGDDGLYGDDGDDVLQGGTGDDTLWGDEGDDLLLGGSGYDRLYGGTGIDVMKGGGGSDLYFVDDMLDEVIEFRRQGSYDHVETSVDYVLSRGSEIESLGTNDSWGLDGLSLTGNEIANAIFGNNGDNTLNGGGGLDVLWGFGGSDRFVFDTALLAGNICRIEDFSVADDTMVLDDAIFSGLTFDAGTGQLATGLLRIGGSAHDADDRIVYNAGTGKLYYDADGNGAVAAVQFAILATGLALTEADFLVF